MPKSLIDQIAEAVKGFNQEAPPPQAPGYNDPPTSEYIDRIKRDSEIAEWVFRHQKPPQ